MAKPLRKAQARLKLRQAGVKAKPGFRVPGSMNARKPASDSTGRGRRV